MTVVVGYLPRPEGEAALLAAVAEASLRATDVAVVYSRPGDPGDAVRDLAHLDDLLADCGVEYRVREVAPGLEASDDLLALAAELAAELVVIGLRRRSPVGKLVLGSHAQRVLLDAPCPVLAVRA